RFYISYFRYHKYFNGCRHLTCCWSAVTSYKSGWNIFNRSFGGIWFCFIYEKKTNLV
ncbi:uncharacterized protein METZ01_LOCUS481563, partial [marine metagenome]